MIIAINFADKANRATQRVNTLTAYSKGKVDLVIEYNPNDIDNLFYDKNKTILDISRGAGLWLWKPYCILKTLSKMNDGDYLMYADSGSYYVNDIHYLISEMEKSNQEIMCFDINENIEEAYTKPETFEILNCIGSKYSKTPQRMASFILSKKGKFAIGFFKEYLKYAQNEKAIRDKNPEGIKKNHPYYIEHREDQSIFSLLTKKHELISFRNPSQWGNGRGVITVLTTRIKRKILKNDYPTILINHRRSKLTIFWKVVIYTQNLFPKTFDHTKNLLYRLNTVIKNS